MGWVMTDGAMTIEDVVIERRGWTAWNWNWNRSTWIDCLCGDERSSITSAMIVRTSPSVPGDGQTSISSWREEMRIRHTRAMEPIFQEVLHAEDPYNTVGEINLDCSRVSPIEIILASMKGGMITVHKDSNNHTGS